MISYNQNVKEVLQTKYKPVSSFIKGDEENIDKKTVASFGEEWLKFDNFDAEELKSAGDQYFDIVTDSMLNKESVVLDLGCGTGRWSKYIAPRAKFVEAIDPSDAVFAAAHFTSKDENIRISQASSDNIPFEDESFDFLMSLGVLHHIPDTAMALNSGVKKVKRGGYVLLYLYYSLDNRSSLYKAIFYLSIFIRKIVSILPASIKKIVCDFLAIVIYIPFIFFTRFLKLIGISSEFYNKIPLSYYADKSFNIIRNDTLDRFGTPLEQRFSKVEITKMMENAGLIDIVFSENMPFWHMVGRKK